MMRNRQAMQQCLTLLRKPNKHFAVIRLRRHPLYRSVLCQPAHQFNSAVMTNKHPRRELAYRGLRSIRQAFNGQQKLMLLRLDSMSVRLILAEPQKPANLVAEFSQVLEFADCELSIS